MISSCAVPNDKVTGLSGLMVIINLDKVIT